MRAIRIKTCYGMTALVFLSLKHLRKSSHNSPLIRQLSAAFKSDAVKTKNWLAALHTGPDPFKKWRYFLSMDRAFKIHPSKYHVLMNSYSFYKKFLGFHERFIIKNIVTPDVYDQGQVWLSEHKPDWCWSPNCKLCVYHHIMWQHFKAEKNAKQIPKKNLALFRNGIKLFQFGL